MNPEDRTEDEKAVDWLLELRRLQTEEGLGFDEALAIVNAEYPEPTLASMATISESKPRPRRRLVDGRRGRRASRKTAGHILRMDQLREGDVIGQRSLGTETTVTQVEKGVDYAIDGPPGVRITFDPPVAGGRTTMTMGADQTLYIENPGSRRAPKYEPPVIPEGATINGYCPVCQRDVRIRNTPDARLPRHNSTRPGRGTSSSPCSGSGMTMEQAKARRTEDESAWRNRDRTYSRHEASVSGDFMRYVVGLVPAHLAPPGKTVQDMVDIWAGLDDADAPGITPDFWAWVDALPRKLRDDIHEQDRISERMLYGSKLAEVTYYKPFCSLECNRAYSATVPIIDGDNQTEPFCLNCGAATEPLRDQAGAARRSAMRRQAWGEKTRSKTFPSGTPKSEIDAWISKLPKKVQPLVEQADRSDGATIVTVQWPAEPFEPSKWVRDPEWDAMIPAEMWAVTEMTKVRDLKEGDKFWLNRPDSRVPQERPNPRPMTVVEVTPAYVGVDLPASPTSGRTPSGKMSIPAVERGYSRDHDRDKWVYRLVSQSSISTTAYAFSADWNWVVRESDKGFEILAGGFAPDELAEADAAVAANPGSELMGGEWVSSLAGVQFIAPGVTYADGMPMTLTSTGSVMTFTDVLSGLATDLLVSQWYAVFEEARDGLSSWGDIDQMTKDRLMAIEDVLRARGVPTPQVARWGAASGADACPNCGSTNLRGPDEASSPRPGMTRSDMEDRVMCGDGCGWHGLDSELAKDAAFASGIDWPGLTTMALGEQKAPPQVDTLRDEQCPVCGETEAYSGAECAVCGFVKPPDAFMDPDTSKAQQMDLRKEHEEAGQSVEGGQVQCDSCGASFGAQGASQPGTAKPAAPATPAPAGGGLERFKVAKVAAMHPDYVHGLIDGAHSSDREPAPDPSLGQEYLNGFNDGKEGGDALLDQLLGPVPPISGWTVGDMLDPKQRWQAHLAALPQPAKDGDPGDEDPAATAPKAGDQCPECGKGTLQAVADPVQVPGSPPEGPPTDQEQVAPEPQVNDQQEAPADGEGDTKPQDDEAKPESKPEAKPAEDSEEESEEDEDEDDDEDDPSKPWDGKQKESSMRPTLARAAEQQIMIETIGNGLDAIAKRLGVDLTPVKIEGARRTAAFRARASGIPDGSVVQEDQAAFAAVASTRRRADVENPANPIPEPAPQAPAVTTEEAKTPSATTDVTSPMGEVATEGVTPAANTSLQDPGAVLDEPLDLNEQTVTAPVAGTQTNDGAHKVEHDISSGVDSPPTDGPMFPLQGPFAEQAKVTGAVVSPDERTWASLRLARLRIQANIAPPQDDVLLGQTIARDANLTNDALAAEINTLSAVVAASGQQQARPVSRSLVPRAAAASAEAQAQRAMPSLVTAASNPGVTPSMAVSSDEVDALW